MALSRLLNLFRPAGKPGPQSHAPNHTGLPVEKAEIGAALAAVEAELRALAEAASSLQPALIPEVFRSRDPVSEDPAHPGPEATPGPPAQDGGSTGQLRDLLGLAQEERRFFQEVLGILHPAITWEEAGARLHPLCQRTFGLSGFYLAQADWLAGRIRFPFFFEAGRPNSAEALALDRSSGLTGWALFEGAPRYLDGREACEAQGMRLTEAERRSGLHTKSWFGVPLPTADPARPLGLMAFHCYHAKAFSRDQQRRMTTLALLVAMHLPVRSVDDAVQLCTLSTTPTRGR